MKKWLKVTITTPPVLVDSITDFLIGVMGCGVEIGVDDHIRMTTLNGYLQKENPDSNEIQGITAQIEDQIESLATIFQVKTPHLVATVIEDEDWLKSWKTHFSPFAIVKGLVIAPSWENYQAKNDEKVIVMDPGMAFGTGHHATTALTLQLIQGVFNDKKTESTKSVLDIGTGTGILGMAASIFGADRVLAIDNDAEAVMAAGGNVKRNDLTPVMEVNNCSLQELDGQYFLVVANIVHDVLIQMAEDFQRLTTRGGKLILSGILQGKQVENIITVLQDCGFSLEGKLGENEWAALQFEKTVE